MSTTIEHLPPELLSEIFLFSLPEDAFPTPSPTCAPLSVSHVCKDWRALSLDLPTLWGALHLSYRSPSEDVPVTAVWLARSGSAPLSLSLSIDFAEQPHQAILDLLCRHAPRWHHLRLEFAHLQCPPMYSLAQAHHNLPLLETFEFHARDISAANVSPIASLLATAPRLAHLSWVDDLADPALFQELPLPRLTRLALAITHGRLDYLQLLSRCPNLEHIRISRQAHPHTPAPRPPLCLPKLTSLTIAHDLTAILDSLVLPALTDVHVLSDADHPRLASFSHSSRKTNWDPVHLLSLVERSACRVESLSLSAPMAEADFVKCLRACDSLKSLTIRGALNISSWVVELLTPLDSSWECLCPSLEDLIVDSRIPDTLSLVEMVHNRTRIPVPDQLSLIPSPASPLSSDPSSTSFIPTPLLSNSTSVSISDSVPASISTYPASLDFTLPSSSLTTPSDLSASISNPPSPLPPPTLVPRITPLAHLRVHYTSGHADIPVLRDIARSLSLPAARSRTRSARVKFVLDVTESRADANAGARRWGYQRFANRSCESREGGASAKEEKERSVEGHGGKEGDEKECPAEGNAGEGSGNGSANQEGKAPQGTVVPRPRTVKAPRRVFTSRRKGATFWGR